MTLRRLRRDEGGVTAIEFALALPVLATLMVGMLQFALVLHTSGGLRHALGEGIRNAKIHPHLSDAEILDLTRSRLTGIDPAGITSLTYERGMQGNASYGVLSIQYEMTPLIPFLPTRTIVLTESKRAYLQS